MRAVQGRQPALERAAARQLLRGQEGGRRNRQRRDKVAMTVGARVNVRPWDYGDILGQVTRCATAAAVRLSWGVAPSKAVRMAPAWAITLGVA